MKIRLSELRRLIREQIMSSEDMLKPLADALVPVISIVSEIKKKQKEYESSQDYHASRPLLHLGEEIGRDVRGALYDRFSEILGKEYGDAISKVLIHVQSGVGTGDIHEPHGMDYALKDIPGDARGAFTEAVREVAKRLVGDVKDIAKKAEAGFAEVESKNSGDKKSLEGSIASIRSDFDAAAKKAAESLVSDTRVLDVIRTARDKIRIPALEKAGLGELARSIRAALGPGVEAKNASVKTLVSAFEFSLKNNTKQAVGEKFFQSDGAKNPQAAAEELLNVLLAVPEFSQKVLQLIAAGDKKISSAAAAPEDAPLGRIAFAPLRKGKPFEPNTPIEDELIKDIRDHIEVNGHISDKHAKLIQSFMANGWYSDVFKYSQGTVYRGMAVDRGWVKKNLGIDRITKIPTEVEKPFVYSGGKYAGSWTASFNMAKRFATEQQEATGEMADYLVVIEADVSDNPEKFLDASEIYGSTDMEEYKSQKEHISFGKIKVKKATLWRGSSFRATGEIPGYRSR